MYHALPYWTAFKHYESSTNHTSYYLSTSSSCLRRFPDIETLHFFDFYDDKVQELSSSEFNSIEKCDAIESIRLTQITPDSVIHQQVVKFSALQGDDNLVEDIKLIFDVWNPAIEKWIGQGNFLFVATRLPKGTALNFAWLNRTKDGEADVSSYLPFKFKGVGPFLAPLSVSPGRFEGLSSGDARLLQLSKDTMSLSYTYTEYRYAPTRVGLMILKVGTNGEINVTSSDILEPAYDMFAVRETYQKNWAPFVFNSTLMWAVSLDPLHVVAIDSSAPRPSPKHLPTVTISKSKRHGYWEREYGTMRGGTPGRKIAKDRYLFFFHSRKFLDNNLRTTYFMGALICTGTEAPFRVTHISRVPIYHKSFYDGPWDSIYLYDYVLFPLNFYFIRDEDEMEIAQLHCDEFCLLKYNVSLVMGFQDRAGVIARLNLGRLARTMMPIHDQV